ncbi:MAG: hypothetical protein ACO394_13905, partial [Blastocatellia bacterium]
AGATSEPSMFRNSPASLGQFSRSGITMDSVPKKGGVMLSWCNNRWRISAGGMKRGREKALLEEAFQAGLPREDCCRLTRFLMLLESKHEFQTR